MPKKVDHLGSRGSIPEIPPENEINVRRAGSSHHLSVASHRVEFPHQGNPESVKWIPSDQNDEFTLESLFQQIEAQVESAEDFIQQHPHENLNSKIQELVST